MTLTRRAFAGTTIATGIAAQQTRVKGPLVWLNMDQRELDDAYNQSVYAPNEEQVLGRWASNSEAARERLGRPRRLSYGSTPVEALDVYLSSRPRAPIHVFIHGGAWRGGFAKDSAYAAEMFVRAGAHFVVPDFVNVKETDGDLGPMVDQVRRAIGWIHRNAANFGGDPGRIYLSGHSSGGHLAAMALVGDASEMVKGALICSGMFDLKPVRLSSRSKYLKFTGQMEQELSPQRHLAKLTCPLIVAHGSFETPEFQRQSRDFAAAAHAPLLVGAGYNHFEIVETLASPYGILGRAALEQMKLA